MNARAFAVVPLLAAFCSAPGAEILPMTEARLAEAEQAGRKAMKEEAIVHAGTCRTRAQHGLHMFDVTIMTPFGSVAYAVFTSRRSDPPLDISRWPIEPPGKQRVIVSVDPAASYPMGLPPAPPVDVGKVVLRRGDRIVEALRADRHEVIFPDAGEKDRKRRGGAFYFPLEPFSSALGDLEVVVIPEPAAPGAEAVLNLKQSLLAKLR